MFFVTGRFQCDINKQDSGGGKQYNHFRISWPEAHGKQVDVVRAKRERVRLFMKGCGGVGEDNE